jgi:Flp pilus assembly protein TadG
VSPSLHRDERGLIVSSLVKLIIFLLLLAAAGVETAAVVFARVQTQDAAEQAAFTAAGEYRQRSDVGAAREAAQIEIANRDPATQLRQFEVRSDGSVRVVVFKRATTLFIHRIGFLKEFTEARGRAVSQPPPA